MGRVPKSNEEIRESIVDALFGLLENKDYQDITMAEIADRAGVNRSTCYRNMGSKDGILTSFYESLTDRHLAMYRSMSERKDDDYFRAIFVTYYSEKERLIICQRKGVLHLMIGILEDRMIRASGGGDDRYSVAYHVGGIYGFLSKWISGGMEEPPEAIIGYAEKALRSRAHWLKEDRGRRVDIGHVHVQGLFAMISAGPYPRT